MEPPTLIVQNVSQQPIHLKRAGNGHLLLDLFHNLRTHQDIFAVYKTLRTPSKRSSVPTPTLANPPASVDPSKTLTCINPRTLRAADLEPALVLTTPKPPSESLKFESMSEVLQKLRAVARDTKGPWVKNESFDLLTAIARQVVGPMKGKVLAANFSYKPNIFRRAPSEMNVTHRLVFALHTNGQLVCVPRKQWLPYTTSIVEFQERYPLVLTMFAFIEPTIEAHSDAWKPELRKGPATQNIALSDNCSASARHSAPQNALTAAVVRSPDVQSFSVMSEVVHACRPFTISRCCQKAVSILPPPGLTNRTVRQVHFECESHAEQGQREVPHSRVHPSGDPAVQGGESREGWQSPHALVGLRGVLCSHHGPQDTAGQRHHLLQCATVQAEPKLRPAGPPGHSQAGQSPRHTATLQEGPRVPPRPGASSLHSTGRGSAQGRTPHSPRVRHRSGRREEEQAYVQLRSAVSSTDPVCEARGSKAGGLNGGGRLRECPRPPECCEHGCPAAGADPGPRGGSRAPEGEPPLSDEDPKAFFVEAGLLQAQQSCALFQGEFRDFEPEKHYPENYYKVKCSVQRLCEYLGQQAWKLEKQVWLIEAFAGQDSKLVEAAEDAGKVAIRVGIAHGQDFCILEHSCY